MNKNFLKTLIIVLVFSCCVSTAFAACSDHKDPDSCAKDPNCTLHVDGCREKVEDTRPKTCVDYVQKAACLDHPECKWDGGFCTNRYTDWWGKADGFLQSGVDTDISALTGLIDLIKMIGNVIFVAATTILGVKYIWGGVESKANVKDSLITLIVAALMFYGYTTLEDILNPQSLFSNTINNTVEYIYSLILYVCNFLAVGGIVYIGVRYMLAGAEGRASLKTKSVPVVLGIIMVYSTITFLNLIVNSFFELTN